MEAKHERVPLNKLVEHLRGLSKYYEDLAANAPVGYASGSFTGKGIGLDIAAACLESALAAVTEVAGGAALDHDRSIVASQQACIAKIQEIVEEELGHDSRSAEFDVLPSGVREAMIHFHERAAQRADAPVPATAMQAGLACGCETNGREVRLCGKHREIWRHSLSSSQVPDAPVQARARDAYHRGVKDAVDLLLAYKLPPLAEKNTNVKTINQYLTEIAADILAHSESSQAYANLGTASPPAGARLNFHQIATDFLEDCAPTVEELTALLTKVAGPAASDGAGADDRAKLTAIIQWLEANQPDVFRRGLWDAINAAARAALPSGEGHDAKT